MIMEVHVLGYYEYPSTPLSMELYGIRLSKNINRKLHNRKYVHFIYLI